MKCNMTLDEAITHANEVANNCEETANVYRNAANDCVIDSQKLHKCANEHRQLAEWLRELRERREIEDAYLTNVEAAYAMSMGNIYTARACFEIASDLEKLGYAVVKRRTK